MKSVKRGSNSLYPFMGSNGIPQFLSPTALYSRSKISPEPGLYPVHNGSKCSKSTLKKKIKEAEETQSKCSNDKENLGPEMYEVKRRGSLAKIHRKKQSDGKRKLLSLKTFNSSFSHTYLFYICICLVEYKKSSSSDDNTKSSGLSSQTVQTRQNEKVNIGDTISIIHVCSRYLDGLF